MTNNIFTALSDERVVEAIRVGLKSFEDGGNIATIKEIMLDDIMAEIVDQKLHTLQQVEKWGNVVCPNHEHVGFDATHPRHLCPYCWQELKALVAKVKEG